MKQRYIDANALLEKSFNTGHEYGEINVIATTHIEEALTIDVAPVVHGHWFLIEYEFCTCSACGGYYYNGADTNEEAKALLANGEAYQFCPRCGAKMDETEVL